MSYESGCKALNLEFSDRVPRTEYSVDTYHFEAIQKVTGMSSSTPAKQAAARKEFMRLWDYAFSWGTPYTPDFAALGRKTTMGHAEYSASGDDLDTKIQNPFKDCEDVYKMDFFKEYGTPDIDKLVKTQNIKYKNENDALGSVTVTMGGIYTTLFSGFIDIFGWDLLLEAMGTDPKRFNRVIEKYTEWILPHFEAAAKSNCKVFMSHDDICWTSGPVAAPDWYRKNIFPAYKKLWHPLLSDGKKVIFTSDGKYDMFFDDIVACGANMLVMEPGNDMGGFAKKHGKTTGFVGNADTRILLSGSKEAIYKEVKRCMAEGKEYPGFIMAVGNHIPANTPLDSVLYYNDAYIDLSKR